MTDSQLQMLTPSLYVEAQSEIADIRGKLNRSAFKAIAKEALRRLAQKDLVAQRISEHLATQAELEELCRLLISPDERLAQSFIDDVHAKGASIETVYLSYLAGAARMLGEWWNEDRVPFTKVAFGSIRIYAIICVLNRRFTEFSPILSRSAVFASVPGETHTLGVSMISDLLAKDGWSITTRTGRDHDELVEDIAERDWRIIGLSAGGSHAIEPLARLIVALRIHKPDAKILIGGRILLEAHDSVLAMRPDAVAMDLDQTHEALERFLAAPK